MDMTKRKCARWCGRGCTEAEYLDAKKKGAALAKKLGKGWKPEICENLGWHYRAVDATGFWKVKPTSPGCPADSRYIAFLGPGKAGGLFSEYGSTPESAVENTADAFKERLSMYYKLNCAVDLALKSCERR